MYSDPCYIAFFLAFDFVIIMLGITLDTLIFAINNHRLEETDCSQFLDNDGNHIYYDRSLIEKQQFTKKNPAVSPSALRTLRRLISELFSK